VSLPVLIERARPEDLPAVIALHEADTVGGHGDAWAAQMKPGYLAALERIAAHPDHDLYVARRSGEVVGSFLLSFLPGLTSQGAWHAQLRSVQVREDCRSAGIGALMVAEAERLALARGAGWIELTSNKKRANAHRFYERLGYLRSHEGFKKKL
jgi:GNAT superfamily N-acetyltransferase